MLSAAQCARIWGDSISERLSGARSLSGPSLAAVRGDLCEGCPVPVWPYGNATPINPLLVTLGASPGGSPSGGDPGVKPLDLPTAGVRHPHTKYEDGKGFWRGIRCLARTVIQSGTTSGEDSYALFGNMNLDPNRSGRVSDVQIDPAFGEWVLRTIRDKLRPKFVICLGLKGKPEAVRLLSQAFDGFNPKEPHVERALECYQGKRFELREWDCVGPRGNRIKLVLWPQHPSRPPFLNNPETWRDACREFAERHRGALRP